MLRIITSVLPFALLLTACGDGRKPSVSPAAETDSSVQATVITLSGRQVSDSMRVDVTGDGSDELVVLTRSDSLDTDPLMGDCFDRIDFYETKQMPYRTLFFDLVDFGTSLAIEDVTGDSIADVLIQLDAGGNNPITARGMHLYGLNDKRQVTLLFYAMSGAPQVKDLDGDGSGEILVSDQFWGMVAHSEVIGFTRDIYAFDGSTYVRSNARFADFFDANIRTRHDAYMLAKDTHAKTEDARGRLYMRMADYLVWSFARGGASRCASAWRGERDFLRDALHEEQYDDLEAFVDECHSMEYEQTRQRSS
ncbi:MAG: hypothetical protein C0600_12080 [Ignavibacteria bacterium]|nr:MAG: hypothetical protein C0600_12080 [Ignavibacteria bacterium]